MKIKRLFIMILLVASLVGCTGTGNTSSSSQTDGNSTSSTNQVTENAVKIKSINAKETEVEIANVKARNRKNANNTDDLNYIIITRPQTDITFTITLDNPEAYAIDALRVTCDDENAQIQVDGEFKPIAQESDGTRVINWASEDPYTKTYNIRTTSEDAINSFKVVDVRLAGHDKFQSKETNSTDLGNNELHIYKMDEDAYTLNVIENTFEYIKFNFNVKDEYKDIISNIRVNGLEMDEELGYWMLVCNPNYDWQDNDVKITYDYYLKEFDLKINRSCYEKINCLSFRLSRGIPFSVYKEFESDEITYIYFGFEINTEFDILFNGNLLETVDDISGYDGGVYYYHYYVYKTTETLNGIYIMNNDYTLTNTFNFGILHNGNDTIYFLTEEELTSFYEQFSIVICNKTYKLDVKTQEVGYYDANTSSWGNKCYYIYDFELVEE